MKLLLSVLLILFISEGHAQTLNPKQMSYWNKLLHYRPNLLGKMVSEVDSPDFFVFSGGKKSPEKELHHFVQLLNSDKAQDYVCKFPLRYKWLKENIQNNWNFTTKSCTIYNSFVEKLDAKNLSLVFSSFYINNPGSTFGHTFLHVSRYKDFRQNELLDYAINFAAQSSKDNVVLYMLRGLGGYYPGKFSVVPYYYKIREYNDHEFRDIWDYDLGLNQEQIDRVIDHVWEMGSVYFDYFYFTENCSYHVLGLLNVAYDDVDIMAGLSPIYVLPIDTVKEMKKLSLIKDRKVRVSAYGKLLKETEGFSNKKMNLVKDIANNPSLSKDIPTKYKDEEGADLLDASISALDYLKAEKVLLGDKKTNEDRRELLVLRAENPHISSDLKFDINKMNPPDDAHDSSRLGIFAGDRYKEGAFSGFEWRAAQHELLDPSQGHLKYSQVIMFDIKFRYQTVDFDTHNLILDRFRMIDLKKYQASDFWNNSVSFDLAIGFDQRRDCQSKDCIDPVLTFGGGSSVAFVEDYVLSFLLGGSYLYDKVYENNSLLSLGPKMNFLVLKDHFSLGLDAGYFLPTELFDGWLRRRITYDLDFRYFLKRNTGLFFKTNNIDQDVGNLHEAQVGVYFYH
jgi:hypothetical protein